MFGVVNHFGSLGGGHYTATCKNSVDNNWYYFNDGSVSSASASKLMNDAAYVLFYRRRDTPEAVKLSGAGLAASAPVSKNETGENSAP